MIGLNKSIFKFVFIRHCQDSTVASQFNGCCSPKKIPKLSFVTRSSKTKYILIFVPSKLVVGDKFVLGHFADGRFAERQFNE